jgi:CobQ-like glutamine amidotransferase family enzyme
MTPVDETAANETATEAATITIVQLYPEELGVAGDRGNVMALTSRLESAGLIVSLVEHRVGDTLPAQIDLVIVGNGPLSAMRNVYDDLRANATALTGLQAAGVPIFAYGSGAELLGNSIHLLAQADGEASIQGLGLFPLTATRVRERKVGYIVVDSPWGQIVGFEDNASRWVLNAGAEPLGTLETGGGNSDSNAAVAAEGVRAGASIATQIGGPVLPLNPLLTDVLIASMLERRGLAASATAGSNAAVPRATTTGNAGQNNAELYAERAREVILSHAKHVFSRI